MMPALALLCFRCTARCGSASGGLFGTCPAPQCDSDCDLTTFVPQVTAGLARIIAYSDGRNQRWSLSCILRGSIEPKQPFLAVCLRLGVDSAVLNLFVLDRFSSWHVALAHLVPAGLTGTEAVATADFTPAELHQFAPVQK